MQKPAFYAALFYIFLRFSYLHEKLPGITGLALLASLIAFPPLLLSGAIPFTLRDRRGWPWLAFLGWMVLAVPFSHWKGGSVSDIVSYTRIEIPVLFMAGGLATSWKDVRKLIAVLALSGALNVIYSVSGRAEGARLQLDVMGSIGNSNDFAAHMLYLGPMMLFYVLAPKSSLFLRLLCLGLSAILIQQVVNTASRGNMIALLCMLLFFFWHASKKQKLVFSLLGSAGLIVILAITQDAILNRLATFRTDATVQTGDGNEALDSQTSREYLFRKSLEFTMRFPVFGVGPGQFQTYEGYTQGKSGIRGLWQVTHNTYTQVSSECGLPALGFYLIAIAGTFLTFRRIAKEAKERKDGERRAAAVCAMMSMVGFGMAVMFLSLAYRAYFPMLTGLAIAMHHSLLAEWSQASIPPSLQPPFQPQLSSGNRFSGLASARFKHPNSR